MTLQPATSSFTGPVPDRKITDILKESKFTLSAEIVPPRNGSNRQLIVDQIDSLKKAGVQFLAVTKGAGGSLRGGSLPIAQLIKEGFQTPCIAHFTSRDLLPEEVENQLIDHHYLGIRNILALRGDPPQGVDGWTPREGSYPYAYQLVEQIRALNSGKYLERAGFKTKGREVTDFSIGVACYPEHENRTEHLTHFRRKVEAGAEYAITQMLFCADAYERFCSEVATAHCALPILPGTRLLRSREQASKMSARFGVKVPNSYLSALAASDSDPAAQSASIGASKRLTEDLRRAGAPGLHLFILGDTEDACTALRLANSYK
jgi:methylenetetrahydrofolate reductase (NADPH)